MKCAFYEHLPQYTLGVAKELGKNVELDVYFNKDSQPYSIPNCRAKVGTLSFPNYRRPSTFFGLLNQIARLRTYDLVHANSSTQAISAYLANRLYGLKYIYTNHGHVRFDSAASQKSDQKEHQMLPRVAKHAMAFVTISYFTAKRLSQIYGFKPLVIHHGVDLNRFTPKINGGLIRNQLSKSDKIILSVMRLHKDKDPFTLLEAAAIVSAKHHVKFVIIGD
ncbi:MAG: glycosyltransferase, partial [Candidatus Sifarchaeia archaeon]